MKQVVFCPNFCKIGFKVCTTFCDHLRQALRFYNHTNHTTTSQLKTSRTMPQLTVEQIHRAVRNATMTRNSGHPFSVEINVVDFADRIRCVRL